MPFICILRLVGAYQSTFLSCRTKGVVKLSAKPIKDPKSTGKGAPLSSKPTTCSTPPRGSLPAGWPSRAGTQSNWQKLRAPAFSPRRRLQLPARASPRAMAESRSSSEAPLSACTSCTKYAAHAGSHFALLGATCGQASERENGRCRRSVDVGSRREADAAFRLLRLAQSRRDVACGHNFAREICLNFVCHGTRPG